MKYFLLILFFVTNYFVGLGQIEPPTFEWAKSFGGWQDDYLMDMVVDEEGSVYVTGFFYDFICFDTLCLGAASPDTSDIFVAKYDSTGIPVWAKSFGGNGIDEGRALGLDSMGNLFLTGGFSGSVAFDAISLVASDTSSYNYDPAEVFLLKMDKDGKIIWVNQIKGNSVDLVSQLDIDGNQNIWLTGISFSTDITVGNLSLNLENTYSLMIYKFSDTGEILVGKAVDLSLATGGFCCISAAADESGNYYLAGTIGSFVESILIDEDTVRGTGILKFDQNGEYLWSKTFKNSVANYIGINDLVIGTGESLYITGYLKGVVEFDTTSIAVGPIATGPLSYFLARYELDGDLIWVKNSLPMNRFGGNSLLTHKEEIYVLGGYTTEFQIDSFFIGSQGQNRDDIFLIRHNHNGDVVWLKAIGSPAADRPWRIATNSSGEIYAAGKFSDFNTVIDGIVLSNSTAFYSDSWLGRLGQDSIPPVKAPPQPNMWAAYPNPFEETFTIYGNFEQGEINIELIDMSGRVVYRDRTEAIATQYYLEIRPPNITDGLYILRLFQNGQYQTIKILRQSM